MYIYIPSADVMVSSIALKADCDENPTSLRSSSTVRVPFLSAAPEEP
jgi:hypothetical protein